MWDGRDVESSIDNLGWQCQIEYKGDDMKTFKRTVRDFEYSMDNLGWMCELKYKGDDMKKFQCTTCGKISTDENEICKGKAKAGIGDVYMCHDCGSSYNFV